jgi:hypothetical protein
VVNTILVFSFCIELIGLSLIVKRVLFKVLSPPAGKGGATYAIYARRIRSRVASRLDMAYGFSFLFMGFISQVLLVIKPRIVGSIFIYVSKEAVYASTTTILVMTYFILTKVLFMKAVIKVARSDARFRELLLTVNPALKQATDPRAEEWVFLHRKEGESDDSFRQRIQRLIDGKDWGLWVQSLLFS